MQRIIVGLPGGPADKAGLNLLSIDGDILISTSSRVKSDTWLRKYGVCNLDPKLDVGSRGRRLGARARGYGLGLRMGC